MTVRFLSGKKILRCQMKVIDVLNYVERTTIGSKKQEVATKINPTKFETSEAWIDNSLTVYLNGLKISVNDVSKISDTVFKISDSTVVGDVVEVEYLISE